ncbi:hypothetical protein [Sphingomonas citri]|jgi:hypothetical protein|uniref:DUF1496 domain-containing protein n=1 Tax=Sphingomonas citri TaxID=2862499 RepID=A0ABS7BUE3_9SPHN|nr:hypothetical protein [Sphingomonas citri]MBW6533206.1 hypothetical protein [Sphingomonas citri]
MMKSLALVGLLALPALASAQTTPAPAAPGPAPQADQRPGAPLDAVNFCYFDGKAFSKGARYMDQVCSAGSGLVSYSAVPGRPAQPLTWVPVPKR